MTNPALLVRRYPMLSFAALACLLGWWSYIAAALGLAENPENNPLAPAVAAVVVLVGLTLAVLLLVFDANAGPGPTPLPAVPGSTGAMLDLLYESVQP